uniref:Uncharacterized protein n=1 Tax=Guillardia theta TaxID=55529 RepID=A0A7S4KNJ0_GUITH
MDKGGSVGGWGRWRKRTMAVFKRLEEHVHEWEEASERSRHVATGLVNSILELERLDLSTSWEKLAGDEVPALMERIEGKMWNEIYTHNDMLQQELAALGLIVARMQLVMSDMDDIVCMASRESQEEEEEEEEGGERPLFLVSSLPTIADRMRAVVEQHEEDLKLKCAMAVDMPSRRERVVLTAYLSAWTLQVMIDSSEVKELSSMLEAESVLAGVKGP